MVSEGFVLDHGTLTRSGPSAPLTARRFGWQGIEFDVPPDWELCSYHGDERAGDAALDDGVSVRLRFAWRQVRGKRSPTEPILRAIRRAQAKDPSRVGGVETLGSLGSDPVNQFGVQLTAFRWQSNAPHLGVVWWSAAGARAGSLIITGPHDHDATELLSQIASSLRLSPGNGDWFWSVYGLSFRVPAVYRRCQPTFAAGHVRFRLSAGHADWICVERWALASQTLERLPLDEWPEQVLANAVPYRVQMVACAATSINNYAGRQFEAASSRSGLAVRWRRPAVRGVVWHVSEQDKVLVVLLGGKAAALLEQISADVRTT